MCKLICCEIHAFAVLTMPTRQTTDCSAADKSQAAASSPAAAAAAGAKSTQTAETGHSAKLSDVQSHLKDLYSSDVSTEVQHNYTGTSSSAKAAQSTQATHAGVMQTHTSESTVDPFAEAGEAAQAKAIDQ